MHQCLLKTPTTASAWGWHHEQQQQQLSRHCWAAAGRAPGISSSYHTDSRTTKSWSSRLTKQIMNASSTVELLQLHAAYKGQLDEIHLSAFLNKLVAASELSHSVPHKTAQQHSTMQQQRKRAQQPPVAARAAPLPLHEQAHQQQQWPLQQQLLLQQQQHHPEQHRQLLLQALLSDLPRMALNLQPRALSHILWAFAKLQLHLPPQLIQALLYRAHCQLGLSNFEPRQLCLMAQALALLPPVPLIWTQKENDQQQQKLAVSQLRTPAENRQSNGGSTSSSPQPHLWDQALLNDLFCALAGNFHRCNAQDAAQAVLALTNLQHVPPPGWLQAWLVRAHQLLPHFTPQGLANAAYGLVRVLQLSGYLNTGSSGSSSSSFAAGAAEPVQQQQQEHHQQQQQQLLVTAEAWLRACMRVSVLHLSKLKPQELIGQLLWAAAKLSCPPPQPAAHHLLTAVLNMLPRCDGRHLAAALYAFATLDIRPDVRPDGLDGPDDPDSWSEVLWSSLAPQASSLSPGDLAQVLWAMQQMQLQPPRAVQQQLQRQALALVRCSPAKYLVGTLRSMVVLGWQLQRRYVVRLQSALASQIDGCGPQDISNCLWALATAGVKVDVRWLDQVLLVASDDLPHFKPQEVCNTLWAVAKLHHKAPRSWLSQLLLTSLHSLPNFAPVDFANTMWALEQLQVTPSPLWLRSFWSNSGQSLTKGGFSAKELHATVLAAARLKLQPPPEWLQAAAGAVEIGLGGFGSQQLLDVVRALHQLTHAADNNSINNSINGSSNMQYDATDDISRNVQVVYGTISSSCSSSWASSIVSFRSQTARQTLQQPEQLLPADARSSNSNSSSSSRYGWVPGSSSNRSSRAKYLQDAALYRQVAATFGDDAAGFSCSRVGTSDDSNGSRRQPWVGHRSVTWSHRLPLKRQMQPQQGWQRGEHDGFRQPAQYCSSRPDDATLQLLEAVGAEAYSMASLVMLMPPGLKSRMEHWPKQLAAERAQQRQKDERLAVVVPQ